MIYLLKSLTREQLLLVAICTTVTVLFTAVLVVDNYSSMDLLQSDTDFNKCTSSADCTSDMTCLDRKCEDACRICGEHTSCQVSNHVPYCSCVHGFEGNPLTGCSPGKDTRVAVLECTKDDQCSQDLACTEQRCEDPCPRVCGVNSVCQVLHHHPICGCGPGYIGDPFTRCYKPSEGSQQPSDVASARKEKVYSLHTDERETFDGAMSKCQSLGQRLATIDNKQEYNKLLKLLIKSEDLGNYWISGNDRKVKYSYVWASTGEPMTFTKWSEGEPNHFQVHGDQTESCVELRGFTNYEMNDQTCFHHNPYICETY